MYAAPNLTGYYVAPPDPNHYRAPNYGAAPQYAHYYAAPGDGWTGADHLNPDAPRYPITLSQTIRCPSRRPGY